MYEIKRKSKKNKIDFRFIVFRFMHKLKQKITKMNNNCRRKKTKIDFRLIVFRFFVRNVIKENESKIHLPFYMFRFHWAGEWEFCSHTGVKLYARAQFPCNSRQNSPYKVLNFPNTFALKPKVNAISGKLRFIHCLRMGNFENCYRLSLPARTFSFTVLVLKQFPTNVCPLSSQILRKVRGAGNRR